MKRGCVPRGARFHRLVVKTTWQEGGRCRGLFRCDCGWIGEKWMVTVKNGGTRSCGCLHRERSRERAIEMARDRRIDIVGATFGRLTVTGEAAPVGGRSRWHVRCDCGAERTVKGQYLKDGRTRSCGCLAKDLFRARNAAGSCERAVVGLVCDGYTDTEVASMVGTTIANVGRYRKMVGLPPVRSLPSVRDCVCGRRFAPRINCARARWCSATCQAYASSRRSTENVRLAFALRRLESAIREREESR